MAVGVELAAAASGLPVGVGPAKPEHEGELPRAAGQLRGAAEVLWQRSPLLHLSRAHLPAAAWRAVGSPHPTASRRFAPGILAAEAQSGRWPNSSCDRGSSGEGSPVGCSARARRGSWQRRRTASRDGRRAFWVTAPRLRSHVFFCERNSLDSLIKAWSSAGLHTIAVSEKLEETTERWTDRDIAFAETSMSYTRGSLTARSGVRSRGAGRRVNVTMSEGQRAAWSQSGAAGTVSSRASFCGAHP